MDGAIANHSVYNLLIPDAWMEVNFCFLDIQELLNMAIAFHFQARSLVRDA
jgi:hypothetical protein